MISVCSLMAQIHEWLNYLISYSLTMTTTTTMTRTIAPLNVFIFFVWCFFFIDFWLFGVFIIQIRNYGVHSRVIV